MTVQNSNEPTAARRGVDVPVSLFSVLMSLLLAGCAVYMYTFAVGRSSDDRLFFEAVFFWYLGLVFMYSSRYANRVLLLFAIHFAFSKFAVIGGKYRTYIYGAGFLIVGCIQAWRWLRPPA